MRALLDLLFPVSCAGCGRPGAAACVACLRPLTAPVRIRWPTPAPVGLPTPYSVSDYSGTTRQLLLAYKERHALSLTRALAPAVAAAVVAAAGSGPPPVVVPVPSSRDAMRARGFDPVGRLARAATVLTVPRLPVVDAVRHVRRVADSAGLTAAQRAQNLHGAFAVIDGAEGAITGRTVVVVDDVITTGATAADVARALRTRGAHVVAVATLAATSRRGVVQVGLHNSGVAHYRALTGRIERGGTAWTSS